MKYHAEIIKVNNHKKKFICLLVYFVDAHIVLIIVMPATTGRSWAVL